VVKDSETKRKLGIAEFASAAPVVIVGCADPTDPVASRTYLIDISIAFEHIVPKHMKIVAVTPLGYPADLPRPKDTKALSEIVHFEKF
jgi:hypothetical protein